MKKLLIVGAGVEQVPAIKMAKEMGLYVVVTDMNPKAPGFSFANKKYTVSTNDPKGNLKVALKEKIDGVMTLCSETAVPVVAHVAAKTGLSGLSEDTAKAATHKGVMHEKMISNSVNVPEFALATRLDEVMKFAKSMEKPLVIKPSDLSGQKGVRIIRNLREIPEAFEIARDLSGDDSVLVNEFVRGPEINVTALVIHGEVKILSISNRVTLDNPYFGIAVRHLAPAYLTHDQKQQLQEQTIMAIRAINLENGVAYPQFIIDHTGPRLLEIAARIPGGHMREVALYQSGIDMVRFRILQSLGLPISMSMPANGNKYPSISVKFITRLNISEKIEEITSITGLDDAASIKGIKKCYVRLGKGSKIPALANSGGRFGAIIAVGEDLQSTLTATEKAFNKIKLNGMDLLRYTNYSPVNQSILDIISRINKTLSTAV